MCVVASEFTGVHCLAQGDRDGPIPLIMFIFAVTCERAVMSRQDSWGVFLVFFSLFVSLFLCVFFNAWKQRLLVWPERQSFPVKRGTVKNEEFCYFYIYFLLFFRVHRLIRVCRVAHRELHLYLFSFHCTGKRPSLSSPLMVYVVLLAYNILGKFYSFHFGVVFVSSSGYVFSYYSLVYVLICFVLRIFHTCYFLSDLYMYIFYSVFHIIVLCMILSYLLFYLQCTFPHTLPVTYSFTPTLPLPPQPHVSILVVYLSS